MTHGFGGWDSAPGCIQQHVPGSEGVYKAYQNCADFFTFGHGSTAGTLSSGVNSSYWILTALGFAAMIAFLASNECSFCTGATFDVNGGIVMPG